MKKKMKIIIAIIAVLAVAGGLTAFFLLKGKDDDVSDELVFVNSVENIMGTGVSVDSRYMGIVETQETKKVNPDSDKKVKTLYVKVGDEVKKGDLLFEYDTESMQLKLRQLQLELQNINNGIATLNQQIAEAVKERDEAPAENKMEYTANIQNLQAQVNQSNYDASSKQLEIDRQQAAIDNNKVVSPMDGVVKEINESVATGGGASDDFGSDSDYGYSSYSSSNDDKAYITIMANGEYRIKGTASEMNVRSMSKGDSVIVHSRLDDTLSWKGTIQSIDLEHTESNNNSGYYEGGGSESASNYPFYVTLDNMDGLILGEHVYIEPDYGQGDVKEGVWLSEFYIIQEDGNAYVWAENSKGRIEKRKVDLGEYDEELMRYMIVSGLSNEDYIAYPEDRIKEGMKTTRNYEDVVQYEDYGEEEFEESGDFGEEIMFDEEGNMFDGNGNRITYDEEGNIVYLDDVASDTDGMISDEADVEFLDEEAADDAGSGEEGAQ